MSKCKHYTLDCEEEKKGCEGCAYCKKSADELLEEVGFTKSDELESDRFIVYLNKNANQSLRFDRQEKGVMINGFNAMRKKDIDIIQIKMEELGWN